MDNLWESAPWFIPTMNRKDYLGELEHRTEEIMGEKGTVAGVHVEQV